MKTIFLEARHKKTFTLPTSIISKLKKYKSLAVFTTVQFLDSIPKIKAQLEKAKIKVQLIKTKHCQYKAQLLGCSILESKIKASVGAFLYIGDGLFHPIALKINNNKRWSVLNLSQQIIHSSKRTIVVTHKGSANQINHHRFADDNITPAGNSGRII